MLLLSRFYKIIKMEDKTVRRENLNQYIEMLSKPRLEFLMNKNDSNYSLEEKEQILKYRLKYAVNGKDLSVDHLAILHWENALPEGEFKTRLEILREYLQTCYEHSHHTR